MGAKNRVSFHGTNSWEAPVNHYAVAKVGRVVNLINQILPQDEVAYIYHRGCRGIPLIAVLQLGMVPLLPPGDTSCIPGEGTMHGHQGRLAGAHPGCGPVGSFAMMPVLVVMPSILRTGSADRRVYCFQKWPGNIAVLIRDQEVAVQPFCAVCQTCPRFRNRPPRQSNSMSR